MQVASWGIMKMNDYLVSGTRQQYWEEFFVKHVMSVSLLSPYKRSSNLGHITIFQREILMEAISQLFFDKHQIVEYLMPFDFSVKNLAKVRDILSPLKTLICI